MAKRLITGLTPTREQAWQERQMLRIARASESAIRRELARAYKSVARGDDEAQQDHGRRMNTILIRTYNEAFKVFGERMRQATQKASQPAEQKRSVPLTPQFTLAQKLWIQKEAAYKVTEITGTTIEQAQELIRQTLSLAIEEGLSEVETAALIQRTITEKGAELSRFRARMISRTETHAAANASNQMAVKASGLPMKKEWIASISERTRTAHATANGQTVDIDEPFIVMNERLMQPGDSSGSAENVINCRCVCGYSLP